MIYVFDNSSFSELKHFYPSIFKSVWAGLDALVASGDLISTKEVWRELQEGNPNPHVDSWIKRHKGIFTTPDSNELQFVATILKVKHFQTLIGAKQRLNGKPVADPFVIACAKIKNGTVVSQEVIKPNAAKIPNVCANFKIPCINLNEFMQAQGWSF